MTSKTISKNLKRKFREEIREKEGILQIKTL